MNYSGSFGDALIRSAWNPMANFLYMNKIYSGRFMREIIVARVLVISTRVTRIYATSIRHDARIRSLPEINPQGIPNLILLMQVALPVYRIHAHRYMLHAVVFG